MEFGTEEDVVLFVNGKLGCTSPQLLTDVAEVYVTDCISVMSAYVYIYDRIKAMNENTWLFGTRAKLKGRTIHQLNVVFWRTGGYCLVRLPDDATKDEIFIKTGIATIEDVWYEILKTVPETVDTIIGNFDVLPVATNSFHEFNDWFDKNLQPAVSYSVQ